MRVDDDYHLTKTYPKPGTNEKVPVHFLNIEERFLGWDRVSRRRVYLDMDRDHGSLEQIRSVFVLTVLNGLSGNISFIDLTESQKEQFEGVLAQFMSEKGQIYYTRVLQNEVLVPVFIFEAIESKCV